MGQGGDPVARELVPRIHQARQPLPDWGRAHSTAKACVSLPRRSVNYLTTALVSRSGRGEHVRPAAIGQVSFFVPIALTFKPTPGRSFTDPWD